MLLFVFCCASFSASAKITQLPFSKTSLPSQITFKGKIVTGARWQDASGENLFFITQTGPIPSKSTACISDDGCADAELYAYCYAKNGDSLKEQWHTIDFERNCPFDLYAGLADSAIFITDLDDNGIAECSFLYILSCRSDISPSTLKLIMHEGTAKYAIRGTTNPDPSDTSKEYGGGKMTVDQSFASVDPRIRDFAMKKFKEYIAKDAFKQF
jgi:hypothetical protein